MDPTIGALIGSVIGGGIALLGPWITSKQAEKGELRAAQRTLYAELLAHAQCAQRTIKRLLERGFDGLTPEDRTRIAEGLIPADDLTVRTWLICDEDVRDAWAEFVAQDTTLDWYIEQVIGMPWEEYNWTTDDDWIRGMTTVIENLKTACGKPPTSHNPIF